MPVKHWSKKDVEAPDDAMTTVHYGIGPSGKTEVEKEKLAKDRSKYHDTARYFVEDLNKSKILKTIEYYL